MRVVYGIHGGASNIEVCSIQKDTKALTHLNSINIGMTSALLHIDWSMDSKYIQTNSQSYELIFYNVIEEKTANASEVKDFEWYTQTCKFGFAVQGIWPGVDYTDVNAVARTHNRKYLATCEDSGLVKLFKNPCTKMDAKFKEFKGHSSHVTRAAFSSNDNYLITTGGNDKTVLIWETDFGTADPTSKQQEEDLDEYDLNLANEILEVEDDMVDHSREEKQKEKDKRLAQTQAKLKKKRE